MKKYDKFKKLDEGVLNIFKDLIIVDESCRASVVPVIWGDEGRLVAYSFSKNITKTEGVTDRVRLPIIGVYSRKIDLKNNIIPFNWVKDENKPIKNRPLTYYEAIIYTFYQEDMNQIIEQVISKFDNTKNCKLTNVIRNDGSGEDKDFKIKIIVGRFNLTVEGIDDPVETHS